MIFYDRETINHALELNENIEFEVIDFDGGSHVRSSEIFKNYEKFLYLYSTFPVLPSTKQNNANMFMVQKFSNIIEELFLEVTELCLEKTLPFFKIYDQKEVRGNVGQYSKMSSTYNSIFPHMDNEFNYNVVCNYWVNVNDGDGTQFWKCDKIKTENDRIEYIENSKIDLTKTYNWFNIQEINDLKKVYFSPAKNNTCVFYFSNLLHSPVINRQDNLRCSIVSWYDLKENDEN